MSRREATPTVDESFARLHRAGWSVGDARILTAAGAVWQVDATNGEHVIIARAARQAQDRKDRKGDASCAKKIGRGGSNAAITETFRRNPAGPNPAW
jgi:hypothetical protein